MYEIGVLSFSWVAILSLSALAIKVYIAGACFRKIQSKDFVIVFFLVGLMVINLLELVLLIYNKTDSSALLLLKCYYFFVILSISLLFYISAKVSKIYPSSLSFVVLFFFLCVSLLIFSTDLVIFDVKRLDYSITRVPGDYYWLFELGFLSVVFLIVFVLGKVLIRRESEIDRLRALALLISITPLVLVTIFVLPAMRANIGVNATVIGSFAMLFMVLAVLLSDAELLVYSRIPKIEAIRRFLGLVPLTEEFAMAKSLRNCIHESNDDLNSSSNKFEKILIENALSKSEGNKTAAARILGISRATLLRKIKAVETD